MSDVYDDDRTLIGQAGALGLSEEEMDRAFSHLRKGGDNNHNVDVRETEEQFIDDAELIRLNGITDETKIREELVELSRKHDGKVMIRLVPTEEGKGDFWFNPKALQDEKPPSNIWVKFETDIRWNGRHKIVEVVPLEVNENDPLPFLDALERFGEERGYKQQEYAGKLVPMKKSDGF